MRKCDCECGVVFVANGFGLVCVCVAGGGSMLDSLISFASYTYNDVFLLLLSLYLRAQALDYYALV